MRLIILLFALLVFIPESIVAQKKKSKYDIYWEQEAINQKHQAIKDSGDKSFQNGNLEEAIRLYERAKKLKSEDHYTNAKIQDLNILNREISDIIQRMGTKSRVELGEKMPELELVHSVTNIEVEEIDLPEPDEDSIVKPLQEDTITAEAQPTKDPVKTEAKRSVEVVEPIQEESTKVSATESNFNLSTFRLDLAKSFEEGFTEEEYRQGRKIITRRVIVRNDLGDEYLKVKHDYGATFYFKNKQSVSINVWLKESLLEEK